MPLVTLVVDVVKASLRENSRTGKECE